MRHLLTYFYIRNPTCDFVANMSLNKMPLMGERSWPSGEGVGLSNLGSWVRSAYWPFTGHGSLLKLRQFHLPLICLSFK